MDVFLREIYRSAATGVQASIFGRVLVTLSVYPCKHSAIDTIAEVNLRRVRLVGSTAEGEVRPVLRQFPSTDTSLHDSVHGWGSVNHVGQPSVPMKGTRSAFRLKFDKSTSDAERRGSPHQPGSIWEGSYSFCL